MEKNNDELSCYFSLIENLQQLNSSFDGNELKDYASIQQKMITCYQQIDAIIALETNHSGFLALCQQQQQLTVLYDMIEELLKEKHLKTTNSDFKVTNNTQYQFPPNEIKKYKHEHESINSTTAETPKLTGLHEIIGHHEIKKTLKSLVILPKTQPQLFHDRRVCNCILLYGPPGTGKTRLVHALAAEAKADFHCITASDILSHYVGKTEKSIKTLFQNLKTSCKSTVLFIDEIDALCRKRSESEQEHTRRIKTEFMCQMTSIEDCSDLIVVCATNCPWDLDSAILRRLHKRIYVPLPNEMERLEFFQILTNNVCFEGNFNEWNLLVQKTVGYSGSDLFDVVQTATTIPLNELEDTKIWKSCPDGFYEPVLQEEDFSSNVICSELQDLPPNSVRARKVRLHDLLTAAENVKCTVTEQDIKKFERFNGS